MTEFRSRRARKQSAGQFAVGILKALSTTSTSTLLIEERHREVSEIEKSALTHPADDH
jgi:hypothetical protein